jgi:imidazole glycerol-phosphate synthase subunit HisH
MILVLDYGLGNLLSICNALEEVSLDRKVVVSRREEDIARSTHLVLPGVGNFKKGIENLRAFGLIDPLSEAVLNRGIPFLGICLGMQLLSEKGEESGVVDGLDWIPGRVSRIDSGALKLPHIGWNALSLLRRQPLFENVRTEPEVYFVHSFRMSCPDEYVSATCTYGETFPAAIQKGNIYAVQFHPEKSRETGLNILRNFVRL